MTDLYELVATAGGAFATGLTFGAIVLAPRVGPWRAARPAETAVSPAVVPSVVVLTVMDGSKVSIPLSALVGIEGSSGAYGTAGTAALPATVVSAELPKEAS